MKKVAKTEKYEKTWSNIFTAFSTVFALFAEAFDKAISWNGRFPVFECLRRPVLLSFF